MVSDASQSVKVVGVAAPPIVAIACQAGLLAETAAFCPETGSGPGPKIWVVVLYSSAPNESDTSGSAPATAHSVSTFTGR